MPAAQHALRVCVLGPVRALLDGVDVLPAGRRPRELLAALVLARGRPLSPEALLDRVWGPARREASVVHTVVARLRRAGGGALIDTSAGGYRLGPGVEVDAVTFTQLVRRANRSADDGAATESVAALRSAIAMWSGPVAFDGVDHDAAVTERVVLDDLRAGAEESLAASLLDTGGGLGEVRALAGDLIARYPFRERPCEIAMLAAHRAGRPADAGTVYRDLRRRLRDELGSDPSAGLARIQQRILDRDPALDAAAVDVERTMPARAAPPAPRHPLIGREAELAAVTSAIADGRRLITLVGPGGVGKTRLLLEIAARCDDPVRYVDLSGVAGAGADELADTVIHTLGLASPVTVRPALHVGIALAGARLCLLLDEAEWSVTACAQVVDSIVRRAANVTVVVSSRRALEVVGERTIAVAPLAVPPPDADDVLIAASPAVRLLADRMSDAAPELVIDAASRSRLADLARRLDGLPLALELVAGQAAYRADIDLADLGDRPLQLASSEPGRATRHRSLRAALAWSVDRLEPRQRWVLRRLGVFAGPFTAADAAAVVDPGSADIPTLVRGLAREALLVIESTQGRGPTFRMLRTVREVALEELAASGELLAARAAHRALLAGRWRGSLRRDDLLEDVARREDDYVEALRTALEDRAGDDAADLVLTLCRMWVFRESLATSVRWTGLVLASGLLDPVQRARLLTMSGAQRIFSEPSAARAAADEAQSVLLAAGDAAFLVGVYQTLAWERCNVGDLPSALDYADLAVEAGRSSTSERLADALGVRAVIESDAGLVQAAQRDSDQAWAIVRDSDSAAALVSVGCNLAHPMMEHGRPELAAELMRTAVREMRRLPSFPVPRFITLNAGWSALGCGRYPAALAAFDETLEGAGGSDADHRAAETYAGAACAAIGAAHPLGGPFLAAAETMLERVGLVLTPWEQSLVADARAVAPSDDRRALDPTASLGAHLRRLLTEIAADVCSDAARPELPIPRSAAPVLPSVAPSRDIRSATAGISTRAVVET